MSSSSESSWSWTFWNAIAACPPEIVGKSRILGVSAALLVITVSLEVGDCKSGEVDNIMDFSEPIFKGTKGMSLIDDDVTLKIQAVADSTVESFAQISKH